MSLPSEEFFTARLIERFRLKVEPWTGVEGWHVTTPGGICWSNSGSLNEVVEQAIERVCRASGCSWETILPLEPHASR